MASGSATSAAMPPFGLSGSAVLDTAGKVRKPLLPDSWPYVVPRAVLDLVALMASWRLSMELRLLLNPLMTLHFGRSTMERLAPPLSLILLLWILVMPWRRGERRVRTGASLTGVLESSLRASLVLIVVAFFWRQLGVDLSRSLVLLFAPLSFVLLLPCRYAALRVSGLVTARWPHRENVAVISNRHDARRTWELVRAASNGAASITGVILAEAAAGEGVARGIPVLGTTSTLPRVLVVMSAVAVMPGRNSRSVLSTVSTAV